MTKEFRVQRSMHARRTPRSMRSVAWLLGMLTVPTSGMATVELDEAALDAVTARAGNPGLGLGLDIPILLTLPASVASIPLAAFGGAAAGNFGLPAIVAAQRANATAQAPVAALADVRAAGGETTTSTTSTATLNRVEGLPAATAVAGLKGVAQPSPTALAPGDTARTSSAGVAAEGRSSGIGEPAQAQLSLIGQAAQARDAAAGSVDLRGAVAGQSAAPMQTDAESAARSGLGATEVKARFVNADPSAQGSTQQALRTSATTSFVIGRAYFVSTSCCTGTGAATTVSGDVDGPNVLRTGWSVSRVEADRTTNFGGLFLLATEARPTRSVPDLILAPQLGPLPR